MLQWQAEQAYVKPNENKPFLQYSRSDQQAITVKTPGECFQLFFSDAIYESIVYQTNLYNEQNFDRGNSWQYVSFAEAKDLPNFHHYLVLNSITSLPWFSNIMPRRRFFEVLACLCLSDNTT